MAAMKFKIENKKQSKKIQKILFKAGYVWLDESTHEVKHTEERYLYASADGKICYGDTEKMFNDTYAVECKLIPARIVEA